MRTFNLAAVGDLSLSKPLDKDPSEAVDVLRKADAAIGNLESPFTMVGEPADKWVTLKQDPMLAKEYAKMGFKVLNIANNHMLDYGLEGFLSTIRVLKENGIIFIGGGVNLDDALKHKIIEKNGIKLAFIGCASTLPGNSMAGKGTPGLAPLRVRTTYYIEPEMEKEQPGNPPVIFTKPVQEDVDAIVNEIKKAKVEADHVILTIHWGMAFQENILDYQVEAARAFIDAGAKLILGHHPHRIQGVEKYKDVFIFYSLGDFFFDVAHMAPVNTKWRHWPPKIGMWSKSDDSILVKATFPLRGEPSMSIIPCTKGKSGQPMIMSDVEARNLLTHLKELSRGCDIVIKGNVAYLS
jgi:poly-gamma-glutamate synthesis protein (capsule biosynthesis protein)